MSQEAAPQGSAEQAQQAEVVNKAAELAALNESIVSSVPSSVADAEDTVRKAQAVGGLLKETDKNGFTFEGEAVPAGVARNFKDTVGRGVNNWRLDREGRTGWKAVADAQHPSDLSVEQFARMKALKKDPMEPNSAAFTRLKAEAGKRLGLDTEIAASQGKPVARLIANPQERRQAGRNKRQAEKQAKELATAREEAFGRVNRFTAKPESQFASGAEIKKATGLGREDILQLGFNSYDDLKTSAAKWQADKNAAAAKQAAERAEAQRIKDYHAGNKATADAWTTEREAYRKEHTPRLDHFNFKERLAMGGEMGLRNKIAHMAVESAAADRARTYVVPTNPTAEARTADWVQMLKEHDRETLLAQARLAQNQSHNRDQDSGRLDDTEETRLLAWDEYYDREDRAYFERNYLDNTAETEDLAYDEYFDRLNRPDAYMPYQAAPPPRGPRSLREKFSPKDLFNRAYARWQNSNGEHRKRNRALILGGALGAVAIGSFLAWKGLGSPGASHGHAHETAHNLANNAHGAGSAPSTATTEQLAKPLMPAPAARAAEHPMRVTLDAKHNSIWRGSADWLKSNGFKASNSAVAKVKNAVLARQHLTEGQARNLSPGYHYEVPREVLEGLAKAKK